MPFICRLHSPFNAQTHREFAKCGKSLAQSLCEICFGFADTCPEKAKGAPVGRPSGVVLLPKKERLFLRGSADHTLFGGFVTCCGEPGGEQPRIGPNRCLDRCRHVLVGLQELLCVFSSLSDAVALIGEPRA
jgi:hypothetical protein